MSRRGWLLFVSLCLIWGIPYLLVRVALRQLEPETLICIRSLIAAGLLLPFALRQGGLRRVLARWPWLLLFTILEMALPWLFIAHAEQRISSSLTGLLVGAMPLIGVAVYRWMGERYRFDARHVSGLALGFAGVAALVGVNAGSSELIGIVEMLGVALCWAVSPVVVVKRLPGLSGLGLTAAAVLLNGCIFLPLAMRHLPSPGSLSAQTWLAVLGLGVVCTAVGFLVYIALIREAGPSRTAVVAYVNPLVAVVLGVLVLGEPLTLGIMVGMPLILVGSFLATAPALGRRAKGKSRSLHREAAEGE